MVPFLFWLLFFLIFHAYFGYPLSLVLLKKIRSRKVQKSEYDTSVTLIITAFNEEKRIRDKLENSLELEYNRSKLQIIVASDGSTDSTNDIVKSYSKNGIELLEISTRNGKESAQKEAVACARGNVIVFSDVATILEPHGLTAIVSNFSDPTVGCVSSEDRLIRKDGKPGGEGAYVKYEMWLRRLESEVNSLVGLSGSFFAARKEVCLDFSSEVQSDFRTLLSSIKIGLRGVSDPEAIGTYLDIADEKQEFNRKVRTVLRGLTVFFNHLEFLNVFRYGFFSYQYFCHKLLRWLVPFFLFFSLIFNLYLAKFSLFYFTLLIGQLIFYGLAVIGLLSIRLQGAIKIPMYFLVVNSAIAAAWLQYIRGKRIISWTPSVR